MSTTSSHHSSNTTAVDALNQQNKPDTTMARASNSKPSSRSNTPPPTDSTTASSKHGFWEGYNAKLGNMYPSLANEQPVEHHYLHHSKPGSKYASNTNSGSNTPDREAKEKKHNASFFHAINERLDRSYELHARPEADRAIEEAKREGEERQKKGIISSIRERGAFGAFEKSLDRAHDSSHPSQQS